MADSLEKQLAKIAKQLQPKINKIMQGEVADNVIDMAMNRVELDVYRAYIPSHYKRTGKLKTSWKTDKTKDGVSIYNTRFDSDTRKYIPSVIETGRGYDYYLTSKGWTIPRPENDERPFIANTKEKIVKTGIVQDILAEELERQGIKIEY